MYDNISVLAAAAAVLKVRRYRIKQVVLDFVGASQMSISLKLEHKLLFHFHKLNVFYSTIPFARWQQLCENII